jgi:dTDP-4-dehydrorhamnose 3,5-epimerase
MPFKFERMDIPDLVLIKAHTFSDDRGYFLETYKYSEFAENGINDNFLQDNFSHSTHGVLRGLHFQKEPHAQAKLVKVLRGAIFDVAVDIRPNSPTFGQWVGLKLTGQEHQMLYIPEGFAHGFCVISDEVDFVYKVSSEFAPDFDGGISWNDPEIGIKWPIETPQLSPKDAKLPVLADLEKNFLDPGEN